MIDAAEYCRRLVLAQTAVAALISTRCYARTLDKQTPMPAVVVEQQPGGWTENDLQERYFTVTCWGETYDAAHAVYGALSDALEAVGADRQTVNSKRLVGITCEPQGGPQFDEDLERHYARATVRFVMTT